MPVPRGLLVMITATFLSLSGALPASAKECKKGKKPCGGKCIPAKKVCKEDAPAAGEQAAAPKKCKKGKKPCGGECIPAKKACPAEAGAAAATPEPQLASASTAAVAEALASQAGQAMLQLARVLQKSGDLDPTDKQRADFLQGLKGMRTPLAICAISHIQLVRDCDVTLKSTVTLPCYLAVDEMAAVCQKVGQPMPAVK